MDASDVRYRNLIEEYSNDPEFIQFDEVTQDSILDIAMQKKFGTVPKTNKLLDSAVNFSVAGIPSAVNPDSRPEDALPMIAQAGTDSMFNLSPQGRIAGLIPGAKYGSTVGATGIAELMRQGAKAMRGEGFNLKEAGKNTAITAGTELLGRGAENLMFRSQIGREAIGGAKKRLGEGIQKLIGFSEKNPGLRILRDDIIGMIDRTTKKVLLVGPQASAMRRIRAAITNMPEEIGPQEIANIENTLGGIAEFNPFKDVKNKAANIAAKESRGKVSGMLDSMAESAGMSEVPLASKEVSKAYNTYKPRKKGIMDLISGKIGAGVLGTAAGALTKNPLIGAGVGIADLLFQSPGIQDALYKGIVKSGASKGGRVGISEVIKRNS